MLFLITNDFSNDSRVKKMSNLSLEMNFEVTVFGLSRKNEEFSNSVENGINLKLFQLVSRNIGKSFLVLIIKYIELFNRFVYNGIKYQPHIIHANDFDTLLIGYIISKFTKSKLIYDSHELWFYQKAENKSSNIIRAFGQKIEAYIMRKTDENITVSKSISDFLSDKYNINEPKVIRNTPIYWDISSSEKLLRKQCNISKESVIVIFQGAIRDNFIFKVIDAINNINTIFDFVIVGNIDLIKDEYDAAFLAARRIHLIPLLPIDKLPYYTSDADIGIHTLVGDCLNNNYALPNKLFEYIQGGLCLLTPNLEEMSSVISEHKIGLTYQSNNIYDFLDKLHFIISHKDEMLQYKKNSKELAKELNWDSESKKLMNIYLNLLPAINA